jgi:dTDP-4-amino-4,6-dideoxygalactose transaminase
MADWTVPLSDVRFSEAEVSAVADVYRSGWLSQGPAVARFEAELAAYVGARHAIAVSSGTAALQLICAAIRLGPGDEVIVPSLTFAATAAAVAHTGAEVVFADIRSCGRPWLAADAAADAITPRTRAIVTVGYAGHPGEASELRRLSDERGLVLIEDAAHALGAWVEDRAAGTLGHAGAFSFFANKNLPLGEGGMVVTDDPELAQRARLLRSHGLTADTWARHHGDEVDYDVLEPGFNFRLDEPRAVLGGLLLQRLEQDLVRRSELARAYHEALEELDGAATVLEPPGARIRSAWHIFPLLLDPDVDRREFRERLRDAGVQTSVHYPPLHRTPAFARAPHPALALTDDYARRTVTIPLFAHMSEAQQGLVLEAVSAALRNVRPRKTV